jgi:hypothetical protein
VNENAFRPENVTSLIEHRKRVAEALVAYDRANEEAKSRRKSFEGARSAFEREFDRIVREAEGSDLPLFNQSQLLEQAQADPVVTALVNRLLSHGQYTNAILVAGYTEVERAELAGWLDEMDEFKEAKDLGELEAGEVEPEPPAFLAPQSLNPIEVADLIGLLKAAGHDVSDTVITGWSHEQLAEVREWLSWAEPVIAEKGEALVFDDLPVAPAFLHELATVTAAIGDEAPSSDHVATEEAAANTLEPEPEADPQDDALEIEPQPKNLPPPARGRRRRNLNGSGSEVHA